MASFWGRVKMAAVAAYRAYSEAALIPDRDYEWDEYTARLFRYAFYSAYYNNTAYRSITRFANTHKQRHGLYKHVRGVYNPVARLCDLYTAKVYGGSLDMDTLEKGAIPIAQADDTLREAIRQVWQWSNWGTQKSTYVRTGANLGDVGLWIVDDTANARVRMEVIHPAKIKDVIYDDADNVKSVTLEYTRQDAELNNGKQFTYKMVADGEHFATYMNGELYAYSDGMPAEWSNDYGFVPMVVARHKVLPDVTWGASAFHSSIAKIDEMNDAASLLNDQIRKVVNVIWYFAGVAAGSDLSISGQLDDGTSSSDPTARRDKLPAIYGPKDSAPTAMIAPLDIANTAANIQNMLSEIERDMPELSLHRIRENGQMTAPGIRAGYNDAIDRIVEARGQYDDALMRAQQMAVSIGAYRRLDGFTAYNLNSYERGDLDHYIAERPVIEDMLSKQERISVMQGLPDNPAAARAILEELELAPDTIDAIVDEIRSTPPPQPFGMAQPGQQQPQAQQAGAEASGDDLIDDDTLASIDGLLGEIGVNAAA